MKKISSYLLVGLLILLGYFLMNQGNLENSMKKFGAYNMKNNWREFNFDNINGETRYKSKLVDNKDYPAFEKYTNNRIKVYKDVLFVYGSDLNHAQQIHDVLESFKYQNAYLFISLDNGHSFIKQSFGLGKVSKIRRIDSTLFLDVISHDRKKIKTFKSNDLSKSWIEIYNYITPEYIFSENIFMSYFNPEVNSKVSEYLKITYDGGENWEKLPKELNDYFLSVQNREYPIVYNENTLVLYKNKKLIFFNIQTNKIEEKEIKIPQNKIVQRLKIDTDTNELYISVFDDINNPNKSQESILFPLLNKHVVFDKKMEERLYLNVSGKYIGGIVKVDGVPVHIWTMNRGEKWDFEVLKNYVWNRSTAYGYNHVYINTHVRFKEGIEKGRYLAIGEIKE